MPTTLLKAFVLCSAAGLSLQAATISALYDISFSIFGKIGESKVSFEYDDHFYHIHTEGYLTGTAASIGQNRREIHDSYGTIENGILKPDLYKKVRLSNTRDEETYYVFDHAANTIEKHRFRKKCYTDTEFDAATMSIVEVEKTQSSSSAELLPYYAKDDLLSLFFNIRTYLKGIPRGKQKITQAAGAKDDKGEMLIKNPAGAKRLELAELMPQNEDRFITVVINQDIFSSDKGELYINLDSNYLAEEAMLKDVLLFGDVRGRRVWQEGSLQDAP